MPANYQEETKQAMAGRSEGRIFTSIWKDKHFRALRGDDQRLYMFLLSQPDLSFCGVIPLRARRWASSAADLKVDCVEASLEALSEPFAEGFPDPSEEGAGGPLLVVDEETGEVLIRSLIRLDGIWKMPNLLKAAQSAAELVESPLIRAALLAELRRLPLHESKSVEVRKVLEGFIAQLEEASPNPSGNPSPNPSGERSDDPSTEGCGTPNPFPLTPNPLKTSAPSAGADAPWGPQLVLVTADDQPPPASVKKPRKPRARKADRTENDDKADVLVKGYWDRYAKGSAQTWLGIRGVVLTALNNETDRDDIARALDALGKAGKPVTAPTLTWAIGTVQGRDQQARTANGHQPYRNPTNQDAYDEELL